MKAPWCTVSDLFYSSDLVLKRITYLLCICLMCFQSNSFARQPNSKTLILKSTDGSIIDVGYTIENFSPNEMGGTSLLVKALQIKVTLAKATPASWLRAVLVNHCSSPWMDKPIAKTYILDLAKVTDTNQFQGAFQDFVGSATGYRYDTACHQELAIVHNDDWLKDPINNTSNFQFSLIPLGIDEDPLSKWIDPKANIELAQAGTWMTCDNCQGLSALARVRTPGGVKQVGLVYAILDEKGDLKWHEAMGKHVGPLSLDAELWEIHVDAKGSRLRRMEFALFVDGPEGRSWDNNCGSNYISKLGTEKTEVSLIEGHPAPCQ